MGYGLEREAEAAADEDLECQGNPGGGLDRNGKTSLKAGCDEAQHTDDAHVQHTKGKWVAGPGSGAGKDNI